MDRLIELRQKQLHVLEDVLQLETQVSIRFLPDNFDQSENFIAPDLYLPLIKTIEFKQKRDKILQEAKRTWLNSYINIYEITYQDYEYQYQQDLKQFELDCSNHVHHRNEIIPTTLFNSFLTYINHLINRIKQEIYYEKLPLYRRKLLRRLRRQQHLGSTRKKLVNVGPQVIIDLLQHPFTATELAYLSKGNVINLFSYNCL